MDIQGFISVLAKVKRFVRSGNSVSPSKEQNECVCRLLIHLSSDISDCNLLLSDVKLTQIIKQLESQDIPQRAKRRFKRQKRTSTGLSHTDDPPEPRVPVMAE
ncbi:hypothetical protein AV530_014841 [Patagioenas fasciata monilis]|uniref:Uncharacterized protein n=1 Tax=Patagioenas fasciata monilis TaxID=372326 RepID=A0A1V4L085_PATFA|nr:hypothetical protein AV530_014841 [Patagioenas fasciata monilis]